MGIQYQLLYIAMIVCYGNKAAASDADKEMILRKTELISDMYLSKDPAKYFDKVCHPEVYIMPPGAPTVHGKAQTIRKFQEIVHQVQKVDISAEDIQVYGNVAVVVEGRITTFEDGTTVVGKGIMVFEKVWQLRYRAWNSNS